MPGLALVDRPYAWGVAGWARFLLTSQQKILSILSWHALKSLSTFSIGVMREQMLAVDIGLIDADSLLLSCERWEGWATLSFAYCLAVIWTGR